MSSSRKISSAYLCVLCVSVLKICICLSGCTPGYILKTESFTHYIESFNSSDNELYTNYIPNEKCLEFLFANIPLFDCPDKKLEQTYYFRWWTYRKHIKETPDGFVITEFLPDVPWAGKYNTISCAAAHHIYEGRWLKDQRFLDDYAVFWLRKGGSVRSYSFWIADALYNRYAVTGDKALLTDLLPDLIANYQGWEKERLSDNGLFWQIDDRDGMEMSVCGSGYRATINAYMFGEAKAISAIAAMTGNEKQAVEYTAKAAGLKMKTESTLWDSESEFFKVLPRQAETLCSARELHGYTPWYFNMPDEKYATAWKFLMDTAHFLAPFGLTTVERCCPDFSVSYEGHECQWNGPSWPYATSVTLSALANLLNDHPSQSHITKRDYLHVLQSYAQSHQLTENGKTVSWIDENLNPFTGDWISRTRLRSWDNGTWSKVKGGVERGKDYNHSTFCDLIISGLAGIRPQADDTLVINPLIPDEWDYFCLDRVPYHGYEITILYDKTGERYKRGKGFRVFIDGREKGFSATVIKMTIPLQ